MRMNRGFSLVEVVVSLLLVIITAIVLLNVFPAGRKGLQLSENHVNAAYLGSSVLDDARRKKFDDIKPGSGTFEYKGVDNGTPFSQTFNYTLNVESLNSEMKQIWVTVTWNEAKGNKKLTLETIRTKSGND